MSVTDDIQRWYNRDDVAFLASLSEETPIYDALVSDYSVGLAIQIEGD